MCPVGILGIIVARLVIDESRDESEEQRLDLPGLLSSAVGLFALTYGLIEANTYGWTSAASSAASSSRPSRSSCSSSWSIASASRCSISHSSATRPSPVPIR